jgi:hypothetical protein
MEKIIHDIETNQIIVEQLSVKEIAEIKAAAIEAAAKAHEAEALAVNKAETKAALLVKLGITEDEARLLLGGN